jgi:hypothetical protein
VSSEASPCTADSVSTMSEIEGDGLSIVMLSHETYDRLMHECAQRDLSPSAVITLGLDALVAAPKAP